MIELTQSLEYFLRTYYPDKLTLICFGHIEEFTNDMQSEYYKWLLTDDGKSYLDGGENYNENK